MRGREMIQLSVQSKFLVFVSGIFFCSLVAVLLVSSRKMHGVTDRQQEQLFTHKLEVVILKLQEFHNGFPGDDTLPADQMRVRAGIVPVLRQMYYREGVATCPVILDSRGWIVMHPFMPAGEQTEIPPEAVQKMLRRGQGQIEYADSDGRTYWSVFETFSPWGWLVVFALPTELKYQNVREMERALLIVMMAIFAVTMVVLFFFLRYLMSPVPELIRITQRIARGDFNTPMELRRADEIGMLANNFELMRQSLKKKMEESEAHRVTLMDQVQKRTEDLMLLNDDLHKINGDLKEAQRQVIQSEKMAAIGQLSAGLAHEIKNPLTIILLSIESVEAQMEHLDDKIRTFVGMVKNAADRANNVVVELLNFSRFSDVQFKPVVLHSVIESALTLVHNHAGIKNITFETNYQCSGRIAVSGGRTLLQQVFFNLFINAVDASPAGGKIRVETSLDAPAHHIVVTVADQGCGIAGDKLDKIFEPFYTTKELGFGTGLGLSTVCSIVARHQGHIEVRSEVGKGTAFVIRFPILPIIEGETA